MKIDQLKVKHVAQTPVGDDKYSLAFTTGSALIPEMIVVASLKKELGDWVLVRKEVLDKNSLQARTISTMKKLNGELTRRLKNLNDEELALLVNGSDQEQKQIIWLAICRHYQFIKDFALEVVSEHFDKARFKLELKDYDTFFNAKAEWHGNLDKVSTLTKSKARQVVFKMMRECGLLNENKEIIPQHLSSKLKAIIENSDSDDIRIFPGMGG